MDMLHTTEVMTIFVILWPILAKIWLPWQRPLQSEMFSLDWPTPKTIPRTRHFADSCYTSEVMSIRSFATRE